MINKSLFKEGRIVNQVGDPPPEPLGFWGGMGVLGEGLGEAGAGLGEALRSVPQLLTAGTNLLNIAVGAVSDGVIMLKSGVNFSKQELAKAWEKYVKSPGLPDTKAVELKEGKYSQLEVILQGLNLSGDSDVAAALSYHARALFFQYKIDELNYFHQRALISLAEVEKRINVINQKRALYHTKIRGLSAKIARKEDYLTHIQSWDKQEKMDTRFKIRKLKSELKKYVDMCSFIEERPSPMSSQEIYPLGSLGGGTETMYTEVPQDMRMVDLIELQKYLTAHLIDADYEKRLKKYSGEVTKNSYALYKLKTLPTGELAQESNQNIFKEAALKLESKTKGYSTAFKTTPSSSELVEEVLYFTPSVQRRMLREEVEEEQKERQGVGTVGDFFDSL